MFTATNTPASKKHARLALYEKTLKNNFISYLNYIWSVDKGTAVALDTMPLNTFIPQVLKQLKELVSIIPFGDKATRIAGLIGGAISVTESGAEKLRDARIANLARLKENSDEDFLTVLLNQVAIAVIRRHESFLVDRLKDDDQVIVAADVAARRMLEFLSRQDIKSWKDVTLIALKSMMLKGLIEGGSGSFKNGVRNNQLTLRSHGTGTDSSVSAETVYGRSGFRLFDVQGGQLSDTIFVGRSARSLQEMKTGHFGVTKFSKKVPQDAKAGYAVMTADEVKHYHYERQDIRQVSDIRKAELKTSFHSILSVDKATFSQFLTWSKEKKENNSFAIFVGEKLHIPDIQRIICTDSLNELPDLKGANLSGLDFGCVTLGGDLTGVNFSDCYLEGATFAPRTILEKAIFQRAHCEFLTAMDVDFTGACLIQANFTQARLLNSKFVDCKTEGSIWKNATISPQFVDKKFEAYVFHSLMELRREQLVLSDRVQRLEEKKEVEKKIETYEFTNRILTDGEISDYIKNQDGFRQNDELADSFLQYIRQNDLLYAAAHTACFLDGLCETWIKEVKLNDAYGYHLNLTDLLHGMLNRWFANFAVFNVHVDRDKLDYFLQRIAFHGTRTHRATFAKRDIETACHSFQFDAMDFNLKYALNLGIVQRIEEDKYQFIYPVFQAFFTARHLANEMNLAKFDVDHPLECHRFVTQHKYSSDFQLIFKITAGLLSLDEKLSNGLDVFWSLLFAKPCDLSGAGHIPLMIGCLGEANRDLKKLHCAETLEAIYHYIHVSHREDNCLASHHIREEIYKSASHYPVLCDALRFVKIALAHQDFREILILKENNHLIHYLKKQVSENLHFLIRLPLRFVHSGWWEMYFDYEFKDTECKEIDLRILKREFNQRIRQLVDGGVFTDAGKNIVKHLKILGRSDPRWLLENCLRWITHSKLTGSYRLFPGLSRRKLAEQVYEYVLIKIPFPLTLICDYLCIFKNEILIELLVHNAQRTNQPVTLGEEGFIFHDQSAQYVVTSHLSREEWQLLAKKIEEVCAKNYSRYQSVFYQTSVSHLASAKSVSSRRPR